MDYADKLPPSPWYIFAPPPRYIFPPPLTPTCRSHPLLEEIRVWGSRLPLSAARTAQNRLSQMRLETARDAFDHLDLRTIRATGKRFQLAAETMGGRIRCLRDALAVGGGYVELTNGQQHVFGKIRRRHLDLASPVPTVAPLAAGSASLSRSHAAGRCPCCRGVGSVEIVDERLFISQPTADPLEESFLSPEAFGVLKGVRRNNFLPFFKRMISEGLWPQGRPFSRLTPDERAILLHGYWSHPGHGTFLKKPRAKPEDVRSWLRWDGLIPAVRVESERSKNVEWRKHLENSSKSVDCPQCQATGLQLHSRAIPVGPHSLFEWVRQGTVGEFAQALENFSLPSQRAKRMKVRILHCLEPLTNALPRAPLREQISDPDLLRSVFERTVHSMIQLKVLD